LRLGLSWSIFDSRRASDRKAWGLLFTCLCTRCLHVKLVTSLDLNIFLLAFSRFTNLRGAVDTIFSDNTATFCAASDWLPDLLRSTEFQNALRKSDIDWVKIPPYSPNQGGVWEIMDKLFKSALNKTVGTVGAHRLSLNSKPFLWTWCALLMIVLSSRSVTCQMTCLLLLPRHSWDNICYPIHQSVDFMKKVISVRTFCIMPPLLINFGLDGLNLIYPRCKAVINGEP